MEFTRRVIVDADALTSTPQASTAVQCKASDQFGLYLKWTPAASGRVLTVTVEVSPSAIDVTDASAEWHQLGEWDYSDADSKTRTTYDIQETASGTDAVYISPYIFPCPATRVRIKYSQSGADGGSLSATLLYRHS